MKRFIPLFTLIAAAVSGSGPAMAGETCYDFSQQSAGRRLSVGEIVQAEHLRVRIHSYERGVPVAGDQYVEVKSSSNAGGSGPEMYTYQANLLIEPRRPVTQIRFRVGESRGGPNNPVGGHANILFNGTRHIITGGLNNANGRVLLGDNGARARIEVRMSQSSTDSHWWSGTLTVTAKTAEIASFGIGGVPVVVDDVCFTPNGL